MSNTWAEDISSSDDPTRIDDDNPNQAERSDEQIERQQQEKSAIARYEAWCRDPNSGGLAVVESAMHGENWITVGSDDTQEFLERQLKILEAFKAKVPDKSNDSVMARATRKVDLGEDKSISDHIGPVQFNMGGIQVDADDMLQKIKVLDFTCTLYDIVLTDSRNATIPRHPTESQRKPTPLPVTWPRILTMSNSRISSRA